MPAKPFLACALLLPLLGLRDALLQGIHHNLALSMVEVTVLQRRLAETEQAARFDPVLEAKGGVGS